MNRCPGSSGTSTQWRWPPLPHIVAAPRRRQRMRSPRGSREAHGLLGGLRASAATSPAQDFDKIGWVATTGRRTCPRALSISWSIVPITTPRRSAPRTRPEAATMTVAARWPEARDPARRRCRRDVPGRRCAAGEPLMERAATWCADRSRSPNRRTAPSVPWNSLVRRSRNKARTCTRREKPRRRHDHMLPKPFVRAPYTHVAEVDLHLPAWDRLEADHRTPQGLQLPPPVLPGAPRTGARRRHHVRSPVPGEPRPYFPPCRRKRSRSRPSSPRNAVRRRS